MVDDGHLRRGELLLARGTLSTGRPPRLRCSRHLARGRRERTVNPGDTFTVDGKTLTFTPFNGGTPVSVTFGDGAGGTVKTLDQLNAALQPNNLQATVDPGGKLTITPSNDYASSTLGSLLTGGSIGGTITTALTWTTASTPVADVQAQTVRSSLVARYNGIMHRSPPPPRIRRSTASTCSVATTLKLTFNETGKSTLSINGVNFDAPGLGLSNSSPAPTSSTMPPPTRSSRAWPPPATRCGRKPRPWVRTCRSCRSARTSPRA